MDLLQDKPFNLRYYLMTTQSAINQPKIYIIFWNSPNNIKENEITQFETVDLPNLNEFWDENQTEVHTVYDDEIQINEFNENIVNYLKARESDKIYQIKLICANLNYNKIVFEPRVFMAMTQCCTNIFIDLNKCAFRTEDIEYPTLSNLEIKSGTLLLDSTTTIRMTKAHILNLNINVYNHENYSRYCTFMVDKKLEINNIKIYSTIKTSFLCSTKNPDVYIGDATLLINYVNIFGEETIENENST